MEEPSFSVIVPTRDRPELLADAVASVLGQTVEDLECLVVVDGGPDPRLPEDPRVRLLHTGGDAGPSAARNLGLAAARGRYVAFLDDDDVWTPERLELALAGLGRAPVAVCWAGFLGEGGGGGRRLDGDVGDAILDGLTPALGATVVERTRAPRFDERLDNLEDVDWWLRLAAVAPVATVPAVGLLYRRHDGARVRTALDRRLRANVAYLVDRRPWFAAHPRAAAFRWKRVGLLALTTGERPTARAAFARSLRLRPSPATAWHLLRASVPGR